MNVRKRNRLGFSRDEVTPDNYTTVGHRFGDLDDRNRVSNCLVGWSEKRMVVYASVKFFTDGWDSTDVAE